MFWRLLLLPITPVRGVIGSKSHATARNLIARGYGDLWWQLQEPQKNLSLLLDLDGEKHDFYVIGLQEAPNFCGEKTLGKLLGDTYWYVPQSLKLHDYRLLSVPYSC